MAQRCPHCMTEMNSLATTCPACGAQKGIVRPGWSGADWRRAANFMFCVGAIPFAAGLWLGNAVANNGGNTWQHGFVAFLLASPFFGFFLIAGLVMRYAIPRLKESWFR